MLLVALVPGTLGLLLSLLFLADALERRSSVFLVRSSLRSPVSYELTERIIAANLAPRLEAAGLARESSHDADDDHAGRRAGAGPAAQPQVAEA